MRSSPNKRTRVLFINSALVAGADTWVHFLLLRSLPLGQFELHAAGQPGSPAPAFDELRAIPGIALRPTNFGPSLWRRSNFQKLASIAGGLPAAASLLGLAAYIRRHRIQILHATDRPRDAVACVVLAALTGAKALIHAHINNGDRISRGAPGRSPGQMRSLAYRAIRREPSWRLVTGRIGCMRFSMRSNSRAGICRWTQRQGAHRLVCRRGRR